MPSKDGRFFKERRGALQGQHGIHIASYFAKSMGIWTGHALNFYFILVFSPNFKCLYFALFSFEHFNFYSMSKNVFSLYL